MNQIFNWKHRHYAEHVFIALIAAGGWMDFLPLSGVADAFVNIFAATATVIAMIMLYVHERGPLCETCISSMPLNVQETVERRMRFLRFRHKVADSPYIVWKLIGFWLAYFVGLLLLGGHSVGGMLFGALFNTAIAYLLFATAVHRRLSPWCPWCRRGGGGEDEQIEAPDPVQPERV